jgi:hypothetical protein
LHGINKPRMSEGKLLGNNFRKMVTEESANKKTPFMHRTVDNRIES